MICDWLKRPVDVAFNVDSTSGSVEICRHAKSRGVDFTAGMYVANTHMLDEQLRSFDPNCKINPPMRSKAHVEACLKGLSDGTISILSSGHRPCSLEKKMQELDIAPFGMVALETAVGQVITHLVLKGVLDWLGFFSKMSTNPAALLKLDAGHSALARRRIWFCFGRIKNGSLMHRR